MTRIYVFALQIVLLLGLISAGAMCEDSGPRAGSTSVPESRSSPAIDNVVFQPDMIAAGEKPLQLLEDDKAAEAIAAERQYIAMLCDRVGKSHWRIRNQEVELSELQRVAGLSRAQRRTYVTARKDTMDGLRRLTDGDFDNAEKAFKRALASYSGVLGAHSLSEAMNLGYLGLASVGKEEHANAREYLLRAVAAWKAILGEQNPGYSRVVVAAGVECLLTGDIEQAEALCREAAPSERMAEGPRSLRYADVLADLSLIMVVRKKWPEAEAFCLEAMSIVKEQRLEESSLGAGLYFVLANVEISYGEYKDAEDSLCRSLMLYDAGGPGRNVLLPQVLDRYAWLLRKLDRPEEAGPVEKRAEAVRTERRARTTLPKDAKT